MRSALHGALALLAAAALTAGGCTQTTSGESSSKELEAELARVTAERDQLLQEKKKRDEEASMNETGTTAHGDKNVVTLVVTMTFKPEHEQEFVAYAADFARKVYANEPGALLYVLTKHPTEPHTYVWVERYKDMDAARAHGKTPYMADAQSKLPGWLAKPPEMLKLDQVVPE